VGSWNWDLGEALTGPSSDHLCASSDNCLFLSADYNWGANHWVYDLLLLLMCEVIIFFSHERPGTK
jgi:hypothetical protein